MSDATQIRGSTNHVMGSVFYKCPVGGFASLRPGTCPKCHEVLVFVDESAASKAESEKVRVSSVLLRLARSVTHSDAPLNQRVSEYRQRVARLAGGHASGEDYELS